jgi:hypothetical protein
MANCLTEVGFTKQSPQNFSNFALLFLNRKIQKIVLFLQLKVRAF